MREAPIGGRPRCAWEPPEREDAITGTCAAMGHDPALMVVEHDGSMPSDAQLLIDKVGDALSGTRAGVDALSRRGGRRPRLIGSHQIAPAGSAASECH